MTEDPQTEESPQRQTGTPKKPPKAPVTFRQGERLKAQGVKVLQFSDDVWDAFGRASAEVKDENMGDELYASIRNSFEASLFSSSEWINQSDGYYVQQRNRVLGG